MRVCASCCVCQSCETQNGAVEWLAFQGRRHQIRSHLSFIGHPIAGEAWLSFFSHTHDGNGRRIHFLKEKYGLSHSVRLYMTGQRLPDYKWMKSHNLEHLGTLVVNIAKNDGRWCKILQFSHISKRSQPVQSQFPASPLDRNIFWKMSFLLVDDAPISHPRGLQFSIVHCCFLHPSSFFLSRYPLNYTRIFCGSRSSPIILGCGGPTHRGIALTNGKLEICKAPSRLKVADALPADLQLALAALEAKDYTLDFTVLQPSLAHTDTMPSILCSRVAVYHR